MKYSSLLILVIISLACSNTRITSSWRAPNANLEKHDHILVIALIKNRRDRDLSAKVERHIARSFQNKGYRATSAYDELGPNFVKNKEFNDETSLIRRLKNKGFNTVMTIALLDKAKEQNYNPGSVSYTPVGTYYNRFWRYYGTVYDRVYTPGYYTNSTTYFLETNVYDVSANDILYSAQSQTMDPSSAENLSEGLAKKLIGDMESKKVLSK